MLVEELVAENYSGKLRKTAAKVRENAFPLVLLHKQELYILVIYVCVCVCVCVFVI